MAFISGIGVDNVVMDIFNWSPEAGDCISKWHEIVMRGKSPLSVAERELIAAYTSGLNACALCYGVHTMITESFGMKEGLLETLVVSIDSADIDEKLKPLLRFTKKLNFEPTKLGQTDADAVFSAGWSEQALHDTINVVCMFNFMNRHVLGHGGTEGDISPLFATSAVHLSTHGYFSE